MGYNKNFFKNSYFKNINRTMKSCFLCLKVTKDEVGCISIKSKQWQELNITNIIEKHLWPMENMETLSWLCNACWQIIYDFHKYYVSVEESHAELKLIMKNDQYINAEHNIDTQDLSSDKDFKVFIDVNNSGPQMSEHEELLSTELVIEEQLPIIKEELVEELCMDDVPLIQRRKRKYKTKHEDINEDPLYKSNQPKPSKGFKTKTKKTNLNCNSPTEPINELSTLEQSEDQQLLQISNEQMNSTLDLHDNDVSDDTDSNFELDKDKDFEIRENTKSRPNLYYTPKTNRHENDHFLAKNFKISCVICQIPIETFQGLRKHFEVQHKQRGYVTCCNKKFFRRAVLVDHVHRHLNPNYFKCQQCGKIMSDRRCLEIHAKTHETKPEKIHSCDICGKCFGTRTVLKTHKLIHLSEEEKRFPCSECGKNFGNNYLLSNHIRAVHLNKYAKICDICGKSIRCKDVFERHMLEHEGKPAPTISCDICGLLLTGKRGLKRHKDMIHPVGGQLEHTCSICAKVSPNLKAHKRHVQYKHELGYDHKCTICEKAFKRAQALTEHMATHTGNVLYTCAWCPKTFNSNANMHNHRKKGHPKEWEEATRKKYSGNLPPNYKPPSMNNINDYTEINDDLVQE